MSVQHYDCIIIGAGAAGLMCAATAAERGRKTLLLDHANKVGKKILMSGGGRCNFTNYYADHTNYLSVNPHFCKSALSRYTQYDFIALVDSYQLDYHEKTKGQLFCDHKAKDLLAILLAECDKNQVTIQTGCSVYSVIECDGFRLNTSQGELTCDSLVIATGGLSIPTMGATGFGYDIAKQFGLPVLPRHASLVPFLLSDEALRQANSLSGVSLDVTVSCGDTAFSDPLLFTHKGLSGPAILQISNYWSPGDAIVVDFLPGSDLLAQMKAWRQSGQKSELKTLLARLVPKKFADVWLGDENKSMQQYDDKQLQSIATRFQQWRVVPSGTEGYRTAEVTKGGIDTDEISSKTFEAKKVPGLYFIGEVLDVTGWLGGFNFQWAWASGWCAGQYI